MFYPVLATPAQFKWLAGQLRACRAIIEASRGISQSLFGNTQPTLSRITGDDVLCNNVNIGMLGFPLQNLLDKKWQTQFQFRSPSAKGVPQYPDGDLYISMLKQDSRVKCEGLPVLTPVRDLPSDGKYPITSLMFRLDLEDRARPRWLVEPHLNTLPLRPKQVRKNVQRV